jgi:hypothetical protein
MTNLEFFVERVVECTVACSVVVAQLLSVSIYITPRCITVFLSYGVFVSLVAGL